MKPLAIDLCTGLHGWGEAFVEEGYDVVAFDIVDMCKELGQARPAGIQLVLQDVRTLHGSQFRNATVIVASPPCQKYSYMAMPWSKAKALAKWYRESARQVELNELFNTCFRIQREASEAAGRHIPLIVENVKGAQAWVGRAGWHFRSYYLWGDIPALMPMTRSRKVSGQDWSRFAKTGEVSPHWRMQAVKLNLKPWFGPEGGTGVVKVEDGTKQGGDWFGPSENMSMSRRYSSRSKARRAASAQIAKIPYPLAIHIARVMKPFSTVELGCQSVIG